MRGFSEMSRSYFLQEHVGDADDRPDMISEPVLQNKSDVLKVMLSGEESTRFVISKRDRKT